MRAGRPASSAGRRLTDRKAGAIFMTNRVLSALAALSLAGIATIGIAAIGPWPTAKRRRQSSSAPSTRAGTDEPHRSPIALAVSTAGNRLLTANQTSGSVSLVDIKNGRVLHELKTGDKPAGVALSRDGHRGVVTHWYGYDLAILEIKDDKIAIAGRVRGRPGAPRRGHDGATARPLLWPSASATSWSAST